MSVAPADAVRTSTAVGVSLLAHATLLAALAGRAIVELEIAPAPILVSFVQPAAVTAGPGERAPELRSAAGAAMLSAPGPAPVPEVAEPEITAPPVIPTPAPAPPVANKPPVPRSSKIAAKPKASPPAAASTAAAGAATATGAGSAASAGGSGNDTRATAPAWAPTARVRYEELLFAWMERHKQYPLLAQRRGLEGRGAVRVRIGRDGRVLERSVSHSTGETMLDQAALEMVRRANPFPAVPSEYAGDSFEFVAPIEYRLR